MTDSLIRLSTDWAAVFRARIRDIGLSHLEVDQIAGLPDGYCNKILNAKKRPGRKPSSACVRRWRWNLCRGSTRSAK